MGSNEPRINLDFRKLGKASEKILRPQTRAIAEKIAGDIRHDLPEDVDVEVWESVGSGHRPVSVVTIAHASGLARQAKNGTLTGAAARRGLTIRRTRS